jgi:hypothetical protein
MWKEATIPCLKYYQRVCLTECVSYYRATIINLIHLLLSDMKHADLQTSPVVFILCTSCKESINKKHVRVNVISCVSSTTKDGAARNIVKPASGMSWYYRSWGQMEEIVVVPWDRAGSFKGKPVRTASLCGTQFGNKACDKWLFWQRFWREGIVRRASCNQVCDDPLTRTAVSSCSVVLPKYQLLEPSRFFLTH